MSSTTGYSMSIKEFEPTIPAEAAQALFKSSNGNVIMQTKMGQLGWERSLFCEDCNKRQSVESLILLAKGDEEAFAMILDFCSQHRHDLYRRFDKDEFQTVKVDTGRRIKDGI